MRSDLSDFVMFGSITVAYSDDDMRCDVLYNGEPTSLYGKRESYDAAFHIYVAHRPDSPILTETKGWGVVGGISMLLDALLAQPAPSETEGRE